MPTPCSMISRGACHVTVRHLHLAACVSSSHAHYHSALFMGTREVARRVAGSGRAFLQHCSLYRAFKKGKAWPLGVLTAGATLLFRGCCVFC